MPRTSTFSTTCGMSFVRMMLLPPPSTNFGAVPSCG
jgi:hypothetical protein